MQGLIQRDPVGYIIYMGVVRSIQVVDEEVEGKDKRGRKRGDHGHHGHHGFYTLPVTIRELLYLNTMHYIVRVMSYIFPAK